MIGFDLSEFPSSGGLISVDWAPIFLHPILESPERLIVGLAIVGTEDVKVFCANSLKKPNCLYASAESGFLIDIVTDCLAEIENDILARRIEALSKPEPLFDGICFGSLAKAEGLSIEQIAQNLLSSISSLQDDSGAKNLNVAQETIESWAGGGADRLPWLVCDYVKKTQPKLVQNFTSDFVAKKARRTGVRPSSVHIDYSGQKVTANFGTLRSTAISKSIDVIKRGIFDLAVHRDRRTDLLATNHELYVHHQNFDDPQMNDRQADTLRATIEDLVSQADTEEIRLLSFTSVHTMGDKLIEREKIAA